MAVGLYETGAKFNCQLKFNSAFELFTGQNDDPERRGVHSAFPAARLANGFRLIRYYGFWAVAPARKCSLRVARLKPYSYRTTPRR